MTAPSEALADLLERHAEHFGMDDTTVLQGAIELLTRIESDGMAKGASPGYPTAEEWRERYEDMPEKVKQAIWDRALTLCPSCGLRGAGSSWAVTAYETGVGEAASRLEQAVAWREALEEIDKLDPNDFMGGQDHLTPAFRQPDIKAAFREVVKIVNRVLHQTDEYGKPLPDAVAFAMCGSDDPHGPHGIEAIIECEGLPS